MKVKNKPAISFFIEKRNHDETTFNIHLFSEIFNQKRIFNFVISKDEKEESEIINNNNVLSIITFEDQKNINILIDAFGHAVEKVRSLDRRIYENDFIKEVNKKSKEIGCSIWESKNQSAYLKIENTYKNKGLKTNNQYKHKDNNSNGVIDAVKPLTMITILNKLGIIDIYEEQPNGSETKFKFTIKGNDDVRFNISTVREDGLTGFKADLFKDFYNEQKKDFGMGGKGLLAHIGDLGLFKKEPNETNIQKINKAVAFFEENIRSHINDKDLIYNISNNTTIYIGKFISFQPIEKKNNYAKKTFSDFLSFRGISKQLINKCFNENLAIIGDYYVSRIKDEMKEDKKGYKTNYGANGAAFFRLRNSKDSFLGAEKFQIRRTNESEKPFYYNKINTGTIDGKWFGFGKKENPSIAIIHEAVIDSLSSYELIKEAGANPDDNYYCSTQGSSHMKKFFSKNMGFWTDTKLDNEGRSRTYAVEFKKIKRKLSNEILKDYDKNLKNKEIFFIEYRNVANDFLNKINILNEKLKINIKIIKKEKREDVNFKEFNKSNSLILDYMNFNDFLSEIKLEFSANMNLETFYIKEEIKPLNNKNRVEIRNKITSFFGTDKLAFALDNDAAGIPFIILFAEMKRCFGIDSKYMVPEDLSYGEFNGLTLNSMMDDFKKLCAAGVYEQAYTLVHEYKKQKPSSDNNDILALYLELKNNDPEKARNLVKNKINQLGIFETKKNKINNYIKPKKGL